MGVRRLLALLQEPQVHPESGLQLFEVAFSRLPQPAQLGRRLRVRLEQAEVQAELVLRAELAHRGNEADNHY